MPRVVPVVVVMAIMVWWSGWVRASLYQPDEPRYALTVQMAKGDDGREYPKPSELPFDVFKERLLSLINQLNPNLKNAQGKNPDRDPVIARVELRQRQADRSPNDTTALAVDLLRLGKPDEAEALLVRNRQSFLANITLAHIYAAKADWDKAFEYLSIANSDDPPESLAGLTPAQWLWQVEINRGPLARLYRGRMLETQRGRKPNPQTEDVDAVFPVRFVNAQGQYEPGNLDSRERAKLPADAVAIVQQMLLWSPTDTRLYWLLAELYAANGRFVEAQRILDECVSEARQYGNRKVLRDHRAAIVPLAEEQARNRAPEAPIIDSASASDAEPSSESSSDDSTAEVAQPPIGIGAVWVYFGVVAAIAILAVVRVFGRRARQIPRPLP